MKKKTLEILEKDLQKDIDKKKSFDRFNDIELTIEYIPVMTERNKKTGRLGCITSPETRLIYESENKEIDDIKYGKEE